MALDVGALVARLTLDDTDFNRTLTNSERQAREANRRIESSFRDGSRAADRLGDSTRNAGRDMQRAGRDGARDLDRVGDSARRSTSEVGRLGSAVQGAGDQLTGLAGSVAQSAGANGGGNFVSGFTSKIGGLGAAGGPIGTALVGVTAIGLAAGAVLAGAIADGMAIQKDMKLTQARLGISNEAMQDIGRAASSAFANGFGESLASNMDAARAAIQSGILTGEEDTNTFRQTIEGLNTVATLMGEDVPAVARAAGQTIKNGLAKDGTQAFDLLTVATRNNLNVSEDLLDSFNEYSTQLRALGLDGVEGWALVSQGVKAGARDTDVVIDALKEFKLRATDGTAAAADGFDKLKVPASEVQAEMAKGGDAARNMMARLLNGLRDVKDPQDRYNAALALFGTKFEDIQDAAYALNLDTATQQLGQIEGAAKNAAAGMSDPITSARNTITAAMDDVKLTLAEAFGPEIARLAGDVSTHKPELIEFFTSVADGALLSGEAFLRFTQGSLEVIGPFAAITMEAFAGVINTMAGFVGAAASVADAIGMDGMADDLRGAAEDLGGFSVKVHENSGALLELADKAGAGAELLGGLRARVNEAGTEAANAEAMMRALGDTIVNEVPDEKSIIIEDNQPEAVQRLKDLGMEVINTPNGIRVTAKTEEADAIMRDFINRERAMTVWVDVKRRLDAKEISFGQAYSMTTGGVPVNADGSIRERALGAIDEAHIEPGRGNGKLVQSPLGPVIYAEKETGWESYIPGAPSKRARSTAILGETARRFGFGLVKMAEGGIFDADAAVSRARSHDGKGYVYGGLDCSGYLSDVFNAGTGQSVRFTTDSDFAAMGWVPGDDPDGFTIGTNGGSGPDGHMSGRLFGVPIESDGSNGIQYGGSADDPTTFPMVWHWPGASRNPQLTDAELGGAVDGALGGMTLPERSGPKDGSSGYTAGTTNSGVTLATDGATKVWVTNWPGSTAAPSKAPSVPIGGGGGGVNIGGTPQSAGRLAEQPWETPLTPQERLSEWAKQALPEFAEAWGFPKPGGFLGALMSPEVTGATQQTVDSVSNGTNQQWRPGVQIDNHVIVSNDQEQLRRFEELNKRLLAQFGGATP